jgi:class 3 adenylate cyclase
VSAATARKLLDAIGLSAGGDFLNLEDVSVLRGWGTAIEAGLTEEATLQLLRVYRDALGRVGDAEIRLFHFYVHERLRAAGLTGEALATESTARAECLLPLIEPSLRYFHRLGFAAAQREDMLLHVGGAAETSLDTPAQLVVGIVFADLSSFTPLTEVMGDEAASRVIQRFAELVYDAATRWTGRVVKQIGDAAMLVFFDPQAAVSFSLDLVEAARCEASFPAARCGVHWGPALYREGDYFGAVVNFAARLVAAADRHQVLVSAAVRDRTIELAGIEVRPRGVTTLKGMLEAQELFDVVRSEHEPPLKLRDLVCGMELAPSGVAARLALGGEERVFCSEACLRRFVANPSQYVNR